MGNGGCHAPRDHRQESLPKKPKSTCFSGAGIGGLAQAGFRSSLRTNSDEDAKRKVIFVRYNSYSGLVLPKAICPTNLVNENYLILVDSSLNISQDFVKRWNSSVLRSKLP